MPNLATNGWQVRSERLLTTTNNMHAVYSTTRLRRNNRDL